MIESNIIIYGLLKENRKQNEEDEFKAKIK